MSVLSDNYKRIMSEIENKISNPEECEFVKEKVNEWIDNNQNEVIELISLQM